MKKKIIIGISAYAGSNSSRILDIVKTNLLESSRTVVFYSLKEQVIGQIAMDICYSNEECIHIINYVCTVREIEYLEEYFKDQEFKPIGIEVPWEDCLDFLKSQGIVAKDQDPRAWREANLEDEHRTSILECHKKIGTRNDNIYLCQPGSFYGPIGRLVDDIILLDYKKTPV